VARSRSSIFSSESFFRDLGIALLALLLVEWLLHQAMAPLAAQNAALNAPPAAPSAELADFHQIDSRDPAAFFAEVRDQLKPVTIVFIGDSQGDIVKDESGLPYPQLVARSLARQVDGASVVSLHLGGANTFEQGALLLGMLEAGVVPRTVFWAHSVFSLRKNEIRAELVPLYNSLPNVNTGRPAVILIGGASEPSGAELPRSQRLLQAATRQLDDWFSASAAVRFSRRELWEKSTILWAGPLGHLVPVALRPRTGAQRPLCRAGHRRAARTRGARGPFPGADRAGHESAAVQCARRNRGISGAGARCRGARRGIRAVDRPAARELFRQVRGRLRRCVSSQGHGAGVAGPPHCRDPGRGAEGTLTLREVVFEVGRECPRPQ